jgi:hypothetical protein
VWQQLPSWMAGGGVVGIVWGACQLAYRLHRSALAAVVQAHRERADAFERIADYERRRADLRESQLGQVLGRASETV